VFGAGRAALSVTGRCTASLATLPVVAQSHPDVCVVWFDAHADSNTPTSLPDPYLGGMVLTGTAGMWNSGLGAGLPLTSVVLVGSRDIDPDELELLALGAPSLVRVGADLPSRLREAIAGRPVYVHLDCDVLEPGLVPTEYVSPGGLSLDDLRATCETLASHRVLGFEIAEFQSVWPDGTTASPTALLDAVSPLLNAVCAVRSEPT
jgi:arginase family enzyme